MSEIADQASDRTAPTLPMLPATPERATHDYERNGTTSLYAALNIQSGEVIRELYQRHRAIEFLKRIDAAVPEHLMGVVSNLANPKTGVVFIAFFPAFIPRGSSIQTPRAVRP